MGGPASDSLSVAQPTLDSCSWGPAVRSAGHGPGDALATLTRTVPIASVAFAFDPVIRLGDRVVRLDTVAVALVLLASLLVAARIARRTPAGDQPGRFVHGDRLRLDDFVFIALAIVPGAVIGGRIGYAILHLDYYLRQPAVLFDPAQGSLQLGLGIVGGTLAGVYAARLMEQPVGRWLHVAALPMLLAICGGKIAQALGGAGQGQLSDADWATSYVGPGPWGSLGPELPAHPAQLYEAGLTALAAAILVVLMSTGTFARRDGRAFLVALGAWAVGRFIAAAFWRDPAVIGPLRADQLLSLAILVGCAAALVAMGRGARAALPQLGDPQWPDPETRPRF
jgi:phosphatidylglycerol---prolipoprotein diacylglyceryl transferase